MKVLFIARNLSKSHLVFDQIQRLSRYVDAHIYSVQVGKVPQLDQPNITNIQCPFIPKIESLKGRYFYKCVEQEYNRTGSHDSFELIHAHFAYPDGLAAHNLHRLTGVPYVLTLRGDDILIYPRQNDYLRSKIQLVLRDAAGLIAVSQNLITRAIELGASPDRCYFQPNGIPDDFFFTTTPKNNVEKKILFYSLVVLFR